MLLAAKREGKKLAIILTLSVGALFFLVTSMAGRDAQGEINLSHPKLPPGHKPVFINKISFSGEKDTYPVGLLATRGTLLVTYYNRDMVDFYSLGGRRLGRFQAAVSGQKGFPYALSAMSGSLAITDFVNGGILFYRFDGSGPDYLGAYAHSTAKTKPAPLSVYAQGAYYYAVDKNFRGWLVLDALGKLVKMVPVQGEDKTFKIPGQKEIKRKNLVSPYGILVTADKRVVLSDPAEAQIKVYDFRGNYLYDFESPPADRRLQFPRGMALDGHGRIHVVDKKSNRIFVYDNYGKFLFTYGEGFLAGPSAITVDEKKRVIYIANTEKQEISIWGY